MRSRTILHYIGKAYGMQGKDEVEWLISGQVMQMGEDLYQCVVGC